LQVLIIQNINLTSYIILLPYIMLVIMFPFETPRHIVLVLAFFLGILIDVFYDSSGIHAAACTLAGFARHYALKYLSPRELYEQNIQPVAEEMGMNWYLRYTGSLIVVHHFSLFYLEVFRFSEFFQTLLRCILSSVGTFLLIYLIQFLFFTRNKRA